VKNSGERILFIGRNNRYQITQAAFLKLIASLQDTDHQIVGVIHTDDSDENYQTSLRKLAAEHGIPTTSFPSNDINAAESINALQQFDATIFLVVQYPKIFKSDVISIPPKGCFNTHRGWPLRGGSIDQRAIYYKQSDYYVILHNIDEGIDTGEILGRERVELDWQTDTGYSLDTKVIDAGAKLMLDHFVPRLESGDFSGTSQSGMETQYENKWKKARKTVAAREIDFEDAKRLARALHHPREKGLIVNANNTNFRWSHDQKSQQTTVEWKDGNQDAPLIKLEQ